MHAPPLRRSAARVRSLLRPPLRVGETGKHVILSGPGEAEYLLSFFLQEDDLLLGPLRLVLPRLALVIGYDQKRLRRTYRYIQQI